MIKTKETAHITDIQNGALIEEIDYQLSRVCENLRDPNTDHKKKRAIKITLEFNTDQSREITNVKAQTSVTLAPSLPLETQMAFGMYNGEFVAQEIVAQSFGQMGLDGSEQQEPPFIVVGAKERKVENA